MPLDVNSQMGQSLLRFLGKTEECLLPLPTLDLKTRKGGSPVLLESGERIVTHTPFGDKWGAGLYLVGPGTIVGRSEDTASGVRPGFRVVVLVPNPERSFTDHVAMEEFHFPLEAFVAFLAASGRALRELLPASDALQVGYLLHETCRDLSSST